MTITDGVIEGVLLKAGDVIFMASHGVVKKYIVTGALIVIRGRWRKHGTKPIKQAAVEKSEANLSGVR